MTEDEAKTKWCPFARASGYQGANRFIHDTDMGAAHNITPCIGSACMAWSWRAAPYTETRAGTTAALEVTIPHAGDGICGLAGAPA